MKEKKDIDWVLVAGFFIMIFYLYTSISAYSGISPPFGGDINNYQFFEDQTQGHIFAAAFASFVYTSTRVFISLIFIAVLAGLYYSGREFFKLLKYLDKPFKKNLFGEEENNEEKSKEKTNKKTGTNTEDSRQL